MTPNGKNFLFFLMASATLDLGICQSSLTCYLLLLDGSACQSHTTKWRHLDASGVSKRDKWFRSCWFCIPLCLLLPTLPAAAVAGPKRDREGVTESLRDPAARIAFLREYGILWLTDVKDLWPIAAFRDDAFNEPYLAGKAVWYI